MDDDELEAQQKHIEEEIRKRRRANAKARKEEEERVLIAAVEGSMVSSDIAEKTAESYRTEKIEGKSIERCW
jgi:hypothetical protein